MFNKPFTLLDILLKYILILCLDAEQNIENLKGILLKAKQKSDNKVIQWNTTKLNLEKEFQEDSKSYENARKQLEKSSKQPRFFVFKLFKERKHLY